MQRRHLIAALLPACCLAPSALRAAAAVEWLTRTFLFKRLEYTA